MKKFYLLIVLQFFTFCSFAQTEIISQTDSVKVYSEEEVDQIATFIGGHKNFQAFLKQKGRRPTMQGSKYDSGWVVVRFVVDEKGQVSDISVIKSMRKEYDQAAIQLFTKSSGYWIPAVKDGQKVKSFTKAGVEFK